MSDLPIERRDIQGMIADIRVDLATVKERTLANGKTLEEVKQQIGGVVFREEYERRQTEVVTVASAANDMAKQVRDDQLRRQGREQVWRIVFTVALAGIGLVEALLHHP